MEWGRIEVPDDPATVTGYNNNTCTELDVEQEGPGAEDAVRVDSTAAEVELHSKMDATTGLSQDQPILPDLLWQAEMESNDTIPGPVELGMWDTPLPRSRVEAQRPDVIFVDWNQRDLVIMEFTRPMDRVLVSVLKADEQKEVKCSRLKQALERTLQPGWKVQIAKNLEIAQPPFQIQA